MFVCMLAKLYTIPWLASLATLHYSCVRGRLSTW